MGGVPGAESQPRGDLAAVLSRFSTPQRAGQRAGLQRPSRRSIAGSEDEDYNAATAAFQSQAPPLAQVRPAPRHKLRGWLKAALMQQQPVSPKDPYIDVSIMVHVNLRSPETNFPIALICTQRRIYGRSRSQIFKALFTLDPQLTA